MFNNYITNHFSFQAYLGKIFARMLEVQIRYIQVVLTTANFCWVVNGQYSIINGCVCWITLGVAT